MHVGILGSHPRIGRPGVATRSTLELGLIRRFSKTLYEAHASGAPQSDWVLIDLARDEAMIRMVPVRLKIRDGCRNAIPRNGESRKTEQITSTGCFTCTAKLAVSSPPKSSRNIKHPLASFRLRRYTPASVTGLTGSGKGFNGAYRLHGRPGIAQRSAGEHFVDIERVAGSIPVTPTILGKKRRKARRRHDEGTEFTEITKNRHRDCRVVRRKGERRNYMSYPLSYLPQNSRFFL